jgi:2-polyprenyl-6-methoxyphenol hydroxylase-like FAD-dependent oxidoreductase
MQRVPVLIVGGSMGGLSTAMLLGTHGVKPLVVERHGNTAIHPRAAHFQLRTLEVFRAAGIEDEVERQSREQYDSDGGISAVESLAGNEIAKYIPSLNAGIAEHTPTRRLFLTQDSLEPILAERARELGADLRYGTELVSFEQSDDGVTATLRDTDGGDERTVHAEYMVACDGWRSPVRDALGIEMRGHGLISNSVTIYFHADCSALERGRTEAVLYVFNDELSGFFRLDRGWQSGFLVINTAGDTSKPEATNVSEWITDEDAVRFLHAAIGAEVPVEVGHVAHWKAMADVASSFQMGRVLIAGDAAHTMPPNGGFGGNTAVQDAFNLAWKLAYVLGGRAGVALLDTYDVERRPIGAQMIEQAYSRYVLRTAPYLGTEGLEPIVDDLTMEIGQIYRSAAVLPDDAADGGEPFAPTGEARGRPGTRAPHLWLERDGQRVSTIDLFGRGFVLLAGPEGDDWRAAAQPVAELEVEQVGATLVDPDGEFADAYGISPSGAVIVRPDGHVAWRAGRDIAASTETVERAMSSLLAR